MRKVMILAAALTLVLGMSACGDDDGTEINVVLGEFVVEPETANADAGEITFVADNQGGDTHELLVVRGAAATDLPTDDDGAFDEAEFGEDNVIDEVEDVEAGGDAELTVDLEPGAYLLLCNIVEEEDDGEIESHFAEGMVTTFTVD